MPDLLTQIISGVAVAVIIALAVAIRGWYRRIRAILAGLQGVKDMQLIQTGVATLKDAPNRQSLRTVEKGNTKNRQAEVRLRVPFEHPFETEPTIAVSLRKIDLGDENSAKIHRLGSVDVAAPCRITA